MSTRIVNPPELAPPSGYSHGVEARPGRLLALGGQVGWDGEERLVGDGFVEQFDRALANVLAVLAAAGGRPDQLVKLTIYVTDCQEYREHRRAIGAAYRARMGKHFPAMTLVEVRALVEEGAKVEIDGLAVLD